MLASTPSTSCATMVAMKKPGPCPRSFFSSTRSTKKPITRDRKMTNVLTTPWIRVSVTMSPLAT